MNDGAREVHGLGRGGRSCSLLRYLTIEQANLRAWQQLAPLHYRHQHPGAVDKVFAVRWSGSPRGAGWDKLERRETLPVGVIIYGMPMRNVALRNWATGNRYSGWHDAATALRVLNQEVRCINRVVIRPEFRGIGLGQELVARTLPRAGTPLVEALAAMGRVNPFFERAGMTRYAGPVSPSSERMIEAFDQVGIGQSQLSDPACLQRAIEALPLRQRGWIVREMGRFCQLRLKKKPAAENELNCYARVVVQHVLSQPIYFLWRRTEQAKVVAAEGLSSAIKPPG